MEFLLKVLYLALALGVLVFVHEMGHYIVARLCGVRIEAFSIGFGPELVGWTDKRKTRWKIALIPLGGFVKMFGEMTAVPKEEAKSLTPQEKEQSFTYKKLWQKAAIVAAGPLINFLFTIVLVAGLYMFEGVPDNIKLQADKAVVGQVTKGSPADKAGIKTGDIILTVNGKPVLILPKALAQNKDKTVNLGIQRGIQKFSLTVTPKFNQEYKRYLLGVTQPNIKQVYEYRPASFYEITTGGTKLVWKVITQSLSFLGRLIIGHESIDKLAGLPSIAQGSYASASVGVGAFVWFLAIVSASLGILNLLPIPMLDGGHLAFFAAEAIRGRPLPVKLQNGLLMVGFVVLMTFMLVVNINDVLRYL